MAVGNMSLLALRFGSIRLDDNSKHRYYFTKTNVVKKNKSYHDGHFHLYHNFHSMESLCFEFVVKKDISFVDKTIPVVHLN